MGVCFPFAESLSGVYSTDLFENKFDRVQIESVTFFYFDMGYFMFQ